jgi:hypothetical protein
VDTNQKAKLEFIASYFDDAEARVAFLAELANADHRTEAMTLCLVYIDSFAQLLCWPRAASGRNFVEAVIQFGGDALLGLVHPLQAVQSFSRMRGTWPLITERIAEAFPGPPHELLSMTSFEDRLAAHLSAAELQQVRAEAWRTTIAHGVYQHLRNPSVHGFGSSENIYFSQTTYEGEPIAPLTFWRLLAVVCGLVSEARRRSEATGQWFGDDRIVKGSID